MLEKNIEGHEKLEGGKQIVLHTKFEPAGDQPTAIAELVGGVMRASRIRYCLGQQAPAKPLRWPKSLKPHSDLLSFWPQIKRSPRSYMAR